MWINIMRRESEAVRNMLKHIKVYQQPSGSFGISRRALSFSTSQAAARGEAELIEIP